MSLFYHIPLVFAALSTGRYRNTFPFPNEIFLLKLCPGELAVYFYLICCENRKSHQCWPSYKTIGKAVGMTENTVAKYFSALECKGLIQTESTSIMTKDGIKRNGNLLYTIPPFQPIQEAHYQQQLDKLALDTARTCWETQDKTLESPCVALLRRFVHILRARWIRIPPTPQNAALALVWPMLGKRP